MLNKELLMLETELPPVHVTLKFFGGRNSGGYTATPPQDITVDKTSSTYLTFTAFRDVTVVF